MMNFDVMVKNEKKDHGLEKEIKKEEESETQEKRQNKTGRE